VVSHHGVERCSNRTQRWVVRRWRRARAAITDVGWPLPCLMGKAIVVQRGARGSASMARVTDPLPRRPRLETRPTDPGLVWNNVIRFCQPFDGEEPMRARPRARSILSVGVGLVWTAVAVLLFIEGTVDLAVFFVILAVIQFAGAGNDRRDGG
jgi:hypothetical protein